MNKKYKLSISKKDMKKLIKYKKSVKSAKILKRIQTIILKSNGWNHNKIAEFLGVIDDTITAWIKLFLKGGIEELINLKYKSTKSKLNKEQMEIVREESKNGTFTFAKDVKKYIKENFNIEYHVHHIPKMLKKNQIILQKN